eukprot:scaffold18644_cov110-Skeletonema_dohrnii-CCMP3373.AAC.4
MSFDVQVKDEPEMKDDFDVETDSETEEEIEVDKLQPLDPKFASLSKFPIGCKVWYDLCKSTTPTKCLQARSASVAEVYIHFGNRKEVYKVKSEKPAYEATLYEDRLIYGANCPVTVTNPDTKVVRNGVIICPKLDQGGKVDGKQRVSYAVQFWHGEKVAIEYGVAAELVKYREEKASKDDSTKGGRPVAAEANEDKESSDTRKEIGTGEVTTTNVGGGGIMSNDTEAHVPDQEIDEEEGNEVVDEEEYEEVDEEEYEVVDEEEGEVVDEEEDEMVETELGKRNEVFEHKRTAVTEANERPKKVAKTTSKEKECTCVLTIPSWIKDRRALFLHLIGVDGNGHKGHKMRQIFFTTSCLVLVARYEDTTKEPMTITIQCSSSNVTTHTRPHSNVTKAIDLIEESIVEFLPDRDSGKKMLYELAAKAKGSYKIRRENGFVHRKYDGVNKWCRVFNLPCKRREGTREMCLPDLTVLQRNDCLIEVIDGSTKRAPCVLISGFRKKDVKELAFVVSIAVKTHQRECNCKPKWR